MATVRREYTLKHSLGAIRTEYQAIWGATLAKEYTIQWNSVIATEYTAPYPLKDVVRNEYQANYKIVEFPVAATEYTGIYNYGVSKEFTGKYSMRDVVRNEYVAPYRMVSRVANELTSNYPLLALNPVRKEYKGVYSYLDSTIQTDVTNQPTITFNGKVYGVSAASISISEGGIHWTADITLTDVQDYAALAQDDEFTLNFDGGETWNLMVDSKELTRTGPAEFIGKVTGISLSAKYDSPRADPYTKEWDTPISASAAAIHAIPDLTWNMIDWTIPEYRLSVEDVPPIEVATMLAEAAGGTVEAETDGTLTVRHLFPVATNKYEDASPAHAFTETHDILRVSESFIAGRIYNSFRITDIEAEYADSLEWVPDEEDDNKGVLRVFPSPWDDTAYAYSTTGNVKMFAQGNANDLEVDELIEITDGRGNTRFPVDSLQNIDWISGNLGSVGYTEGSTTITILNGNGLYGLMSLSYYTKCKKYAVETSTPLVPDVDLHVQFVLERPNVDIEG